MGLINLMAYDNAQGYLLIRMFWCDAEGRDRCGDLRVIVCRTRNLFIAQMSWMELRRLCKLVNGSESNFSIPKEMPVAEHVLEVYNRSGDFELML